MADRLAILILDADMAEPDMIEQLQKTLEPLVACHTRPYADEHLLSERIHLVVTLLKQVHFSVEPPPPQDKGPTPNFTPYRTPDEKVNCIFM